MGEFCPQGVLLSGGDPSLLAIIIATSLLVILAALATLFHEIGHALAGYVIGGSASPTGWGGGFLLGGLAYEKVDGTMRRGELKFFPHVAFSDDIDVTVCQFRCVVAAGPLTNLVFALASLALIGRLCDFNFVDNMKLFYHAATAIRYHCDVVVSDAQVDPATIVCWGAVYWFGWINVFLGLANLLPVHKYFDGYKLIWPSTMLKSRS